MKGAFVIKNERYVLGPSSLNELTDVVLSTFSDRISIDFAEFVRRWHL